MAQWTVLNGTNVSTSHVDLLDKSLIALEIPSGYTAGNITFQSTSDPASNNWSDVYDANGIQVAITVGGGSRIISLTGSQMQALAGLTYVKIKTATNVTADRVINLIAKIRR